jgi:hypothetical protein
MGVVWTAEQTQPVQRKVALKVIKPGMDSRQVIARFEAERQALAMMDHVNTARVFDGGATEAGRPFFVMELVHGVPITKYCDDNHLTPRERLELFVPVCQAIQHAHQKGIQGTRFADRCDANQFEAALQEVLADLVGALQVLGPDDGKRDRAVPSNSATADPRPATCLARRWHGDLPLARTGLAMV